MKLKKIASLALAGIMAVSMLAGCKDNPSSSSEPTTPPETVTGAAAAINAELDENGDKISFTNDSVIQDMLTKYYSNNVVSISTANNAATSVSPLTNSDGLVTALSNVLKANYTKFDDNGAYVASDGYCVSGNLNSKKDTDVEVYVLNAERLTEAGALKLVGQYLDDVELPEENSDGTKNYSYAGTVAAIKADTEGKTGSVWVIAATITQTPSDK